jgi:hypothetical protein
MAKRELAFRPSTRAAASLVVRPAPASPAVDSPSSATGETGRARKLVLTTGLVDVLPDEDALRLAGGSAEGVVRDGLGAVLSR